MSNALKAFLFLGVKRPRRVLKMVKPVFSESRWRLIIAGCLALLCVAALFTMAPVRRAAADFLGVFRVRKFAVIPINPEQAGRLESLAELLDEGAFGKPIVVREEGQPQPVADAAEASALAGFPVRIPTALPANAYLSSFEVARGPALHYEMDRATLQALLTAAEVNDATLPDVERLAIDLDLPTLVTQSYRLATARLTIVQAPSPEVLLTPDVDLVAFGELGLRALGLPEEEARRMARHIDWATTVVIPLPTDVAQFREISIDGTEGLLLEASPHEDGGYDRMLIWQRDGIVYAVSGRYLDSKLLVEIADSLR